MSISIAPDGTEYSFPTQEEDKKEFDILKTLSEKERKNGRKIVAFADGHKSYKKLVPDDVVKMCKRKQ